MPVFKKITLVLCLIISSCYLYADILHAVLYRKWAFQYTKNNKHSVMPKIFIAENDILTVFKKMTNTDFL
jgi:hypothetical protein